MTSARRRPTRTSSTHRARSCRVSPRLVGVEPSRQWLDGACARLDVGRSGSAAEQLTATELVEPRSSCAPGTLALPERPDRP
ncbi:MULTISPECIES: hypothetical protein [unclassified Streptomyces]|uniref:hypothetical protein n=1 Tax=unclassified Streptomyces TaxID=2593676 RepID=UPI00136D617B|nr:MULTISPECIES: hypothetical protein [unclassified Streptomyces]NEA00889.1 hypothetical protein [Streptomyces sp. SID10116]MYY80136.1 hypothetical protein [Streptomyces sp. SID335]MYZ13330.1 hypothetical protein [Streptomyces sp. SID337]NDZ85352.1 hypothetical protein [Streptomyces sp. SID10115]NEB46538.1 hypothetical protein [Streptomyces sp. SID339]